MYQCAGKNNQHYLHVKDVNVYLGRQGGEGSPIEKTSWRPDSNIRKAKSVLLLVQSNERVREMRPFDEGALPPQST